MNTEWLGQLAIIFSYLILPFRFLFSWLLYLLSWLLAPLFFLGRTGKHVSMLPIRFLAQFEVCSPSNHRIFSRIYTRRDIHVI